MKNVIQKKKKEEEGKTNLYLWIAGKSKMAIVLSFNEKLPLY